MDVYKYSYEALITLNAKLITWIMYIILEWFIRNARWSKAFLFHLSGRNHFSKTWFDISNKTIQDSSRFCPHVLPLLHILDVVMNSSGRGRLEDRIFLLSMVRLPNFPCFCSHEHGGMQSSWWPTTYQSRKIPTSCVFEIWSNLRKRSSYFIFMGSFHVSSTK